MRRRDVLALLSGTALTSPRLAPAQEPPRIPRIGVMMGSSPAIEAERFGAFRVALERLGYVEGRTILIEPRYGESQPDRFSIIAREMVERRPTVIVCVGSQEAAALQAATRRSRSCSPRPVVPWSSVLSRASHGQAVTSRVSPRCRANSIRSG